MGETALLARVLKYAATDSPQSFATQTLGSLNQVDERQIRWALDAGLGPLLYRATRDCVDMVPVRWRSVLLSADLTAQVKHGKLVDTASEVIDVCQGMQIRPTLLKGISISEQHYPIAHSRPMGDIDILIPPNAYESVESALLQRGYIRDANSTVPQGAEHGIPLAHPECQVWVELHTSLFGDPLRDKVFDPSNVAAHSVVSTFHGRPVYRFTDELQLLYIASKWYDDLAQNSIHPSGIAPLLDVLYLLKASGKSLDHTRLAVGPGSEMAIASLYVMLAYLARHGLGAESHRLSRVLASSQRIVGPLQLKIIHAALDRYLIGGRYWNLRLPLPVPGRYSVRRQFRKRFRARRSMPPDASPR